MLKSKTVWAGILAALATVAEALQVVVTAVLAIFLRHGISKTQDAAESAVDAASHILPTPKKKLTRKAL
jgi:hypothetical protein